MINIHGHEAKEEPPSETQEHSRSSERLTPDLAQEKHTFRTVSSRSGEVQGMEGQLPTTSAAGDGLLSALSLLCTAAPRPPCARLTLVACVS